tara:strand:+ start:1649 stop:2482 length:834 start_codon:yes stop_codon:yes gene_type:complete
MASFYIELKELRKSKEISLDQIHQRTKINMRYLEAIEAGNFDILPIPYLRLFLRAYAKEIGGDANNALEQLESFLGTSKKIHTIKSKPKIEEEYEDENFMAKDFYSYIPQLPAINLRQDLIKASVLLLVFIFIIFIAQKIDSAKSHNFHEKSIIQNSKTKILSDKDLIANYIKHQSSEELLPNIKPPFFIKLIAKKNIAFTLKKGNSQTTENRLENGDQIVLKAFVQKSELLFSHTNGLSLYINGYPINVRDYPYPLKMIINPNPPSLIIQKYQPLQ